MDRRSNSPPPSRDKLEVSVIISPRGFYLKFRVLFLLSISCVLFAADQVALAPNTIVEQYAAVARSQQQALHGASMEVEIAASLPKLKKQGKLHALRRISEIGRITYEALGFEGDGAIKNQVISRYLSSEVEAQKEQAPSLAVTPENYKFKYKGHNQVDGRDIHVFEVSPLKKLVGMFKGEVWIDAVTYLRIQESGTLVKRPSVFLKKVAFVRKYIIRDGVSVPLQVKSTADVRLVGKAELTIDFMHVSMDGARRAAAGGFDDNQ
jgi:hypothetical protein